MTDATYCDGYFHLGRAGALYQAEIDRLQHRLQRVIINHAREHD